MKRENVVRRTKPLQYPVRAGLPLYTPTDAEEGGQDALRLRGRPLGHAASKNSAISGGSASPFSIRSAITLNASTLVLARASASVAPYAITPGSAGISAIQRPSSSRSVSILSIAIFAGWELSDF